MKLVKLLLASVGVVSLFCYALIGYVFWDLKRCFKTASIGR